VLLLASSYWAMQMGTFAGAAFMMLEKEGE
jgi:hypothetical protein